MSKEPAIYPITPLRQYTPVIGQTMRAVNAAAPRNTLAGNVLYQSTAFAENFATFGSRTSKQGNRDFGGHAGWHRDGTKKTLKLLQDLGVNNRVQAVVTGIWLRLVHIDPVLPEA